MSDSTSIAECYLKVVLWGLMVYNSSQVQSNLRVVNIFPTVTFFMSPPSVYWFWFIFNALKVELLVTEEQVQTLHFLKKMEGIKG